MKVFKIRREKNVNVTFETGNNFTYALVCFSGAMIMKPAIEKTCDMVVEGTGMVTEAIKDFAHMKHEVRMAVKQAR